MRIEQLLLLLVRVLVILLVVLALAEPFLRSVSPLSLGEGRTHRVIVIDGSYSMGYRPTGQSAFEVAKQRIAELVQNGQPGDGYSLILMGDRPEAIVGQATFDRQQFLSELEKLELREGGADLDALLRAVEEVIDEHYAGQLAALGESDPELSAIIGEYRADEAEHRQTALDHGARDALAYPALTVAVKSASRLAIWLSERF